MISHTAQIITSQEEELTRLHQQQRILFALVGKCIDFLKHNNITCSEDVDETLKGLAQIFRREGAEELFSDIQAMEI